MKNQQIRHEIALNLNYGQTIYSQNQTRPKGEAWFTAAKYGRCGPRTRTIICISYFTPLRIRIDTARIQPSLMIPEIPTGGMIELVKNRLKQSRNYRITY